MRRSYVLISAVPRTIILSWRAERRNFEEKLSDFNMSRVASAFADFN